MRRTRTGRNRFKNTVTTKSGNSIKINHSLSDVVKSRRAARRAEKAAYLSTLPKDRWKRMVYRMQPKRVAQYWFSRQGAIMALKIIGVSIVVGFFMTIGMFAYFRKDLPKIKDISGDNIGGNITYYDRTGKVVLWQDYNAVKRIPVQGNQISGYMKDATVAIEDRNFYKHGAFDVRGIMRAGWHDLTGSGGAVQGGSTITQQLVKLNEGWTDNRTITRKVKELILAVELEREYTKSDILTGYLNIAPYGGVEYGVESAAEDYFHTSAKKLTLPEAAMLAAIPQSPSYYSPYSSSKYNPEVTEDTFSQTALLDRQHYILDQMAEQGYISQAQADAAKQVNVLALVHQQVPKYQGIKAPYFVLAAKQELEQTYGAATVKRGGWKVITTLDMNLQNKAKQLVDDNLPHISPYGADEEATVLEDVPTGQMLALVGGTDFNNPNYGQNNYAAGVPIPPGSSFKPYDYTTFINNNNNVGAGSVLYDSQGPLPGYPCTIKGLPPPKGNGNCLEDYDFRYPGPLTLRYALGGSRNVPAVKTMLEAVPNDNSTDKVKSVNKVISTAGAMMDNTYDEEHHLSPYNCYADAALTKTTQCYSSSAIGDGAFLHLDDHVNGLSTLGRMGKAIPRTYILKITDAAGKTVYQWKQPKGKQVVKKDSAYIVDNMLSDPRATYLPGSCTATNCTPLAYGGYKFQRYNGWDFAVKTGTTNDGYDGLMTSWSTKYAVVSWVGNHTRNVTLNSAMEYLTEPLTRNLMEYAHRNLKPDNWKQPKDIKTLPAFVVRNHIHYGDVEPSPSFDLFPSWYVGGNSSKSNSSTVIDRVSGKAATSCTPAAAKEYNYGGGGGGSLATWNVDIFEGGTPNIGGKHASSSGPTATDDVHNCNDSPPTVTLTAPNTCPASGCTITATVTQGTHKLTDPQYPNFPGTLTFTLNGQVIHTSNVSNSPSTVSFNYVPTVGGSGVLTATVTDSVLYSGSASATMTYQAKSPITGFLATGNGNTVNFAWNGGSGNFTITNNDNGAQLCSTPSRKCSTPESSAPYGTSVTITDSNNPPDTATRTVNGR